MIIIVSIFLLQELFIILYTSKFIFLIEIITQIIYVNYLVAQLVKYLCNVGLG